MQIKQEVFLTLQKQLEMAEIDMVKNTPVINVLDHAVPAQIQAKPNKKVLIVLGGFIGVFISIGWLILISFIRRFKIKESEIKFS